ncbi:hypothetical protein ACE3MS_13445 [Paenibacillus dendritiformis]|uniref:hypothetical protein n=1 Tax=Paenibacillus dendritiformis TaxID=130049 RepID=UPI00364A08BA
MAQVRARKRQQEEHKEKLWNALLSGYRSVGAFSEQDEAAVELFVINGRARFHGRRAERLRRGVS